MDPIMNDWIPGRKGTFNLQTMDNGDQDKNLEAWGKGRKGSSKGKQIVVICVRHGYGPRERQPWILDEPHEDAQAWP